MKKSATALFLVMICSFQAFPQNEVLKLWPSGVPGSIPNSSYKEEVQTINGYPARYSKVTEPTLTVFLPPADKATGMAVLICPGGGYGILAFDHEGYQIAKWLNGNGIAGVILKYRLPSDEIMKDKKNGPLQDAQEGIRMIRRNSAVWNIDPRKVGVIGFSAGGHLASTLSTHYMDEVYSSDTTSARPDFSILIYPVITFDQAFTHMGSRNNLLGNNPDNGLIQHFSNEKQVNKETPPAFIVHSMDDKTVPGKNSIEYYNSLIKFDIPSELHVFRKGGHGYGLSSGNGTQAAWPELCIGWLRSL
jgi:acetyl esterase/lipase